MCFSRPVAAIALFSIDEGFLPNFLYDKLLVILSLHDIPSIENYQVREISLVYFLKDLWTLGGMN